MLLLTHGYGTNPYMLSLDAEEWAAYLLPGVVGPLAASTVLGAYWRQGAAGAVNFAEVGIAYGAPVPGDDVSIKLVGVTDATATFGEEAPIDCNVTRDIALSYDVPAGATLWLLVNVNRSGVDGPAPQVVGAQVMDPCAAGLVLTRSVAGSMADDLGEIATFTKQRTRRPIQAAVTVP